MSQIAKGKVAPMGDGQALAYAGVDGQYFSAMLLPQIAALDDVWFDTTEAVVVGPTPEAARYGVHECHEPNDSQIDRLGSGRQVHR